MRLLLDTHCWLWMELQPERFSAVTRALIESAGAELFLSAASAWEIGLKHAAGKLPMPIPPLRYVEERLVRNAVTTLPITHAHALRSTGLPRHHRDPFDRLLIAQAQIEHIPLVKIGRAHV